MALHVVRSSTVEKLRLECKRNIRLFILPAAPGDQLTLGIGSRRLYGRSLGCNEMQQDVQERIEVRPQS